MTRRPSSRTLARSCAERSRRGAADRWRLVPTMGALHDGHAALMERARDRGRIRRPRRGHSIFVNPLQFGAGEDLDRYPRTFDADLELLRRAGRRRGLRAVGRRGLPGGDAAGHGRPRSARRRCSRERTRPGHFDGVLTVVAKLFDLIRPGRRGLRGEGRPAARADPADGRATWTCRSTSSACRHGPRDRRPRAVQPQPLPRPPSSAGRAGAAPRALSRPARRRGARRATPSSTRPAHELAPRPGVDLDYLELVRPRTSRRRRRTAGSARLLVAAPGRAAPG